MSARVGGHKECASSVSSRHGPLGRVPPVPLFLAQLSSADGTGHVDQWTAQVVGTVKHRVHESFARVTISNCSLNATIVLAYKQTSSTRISI